MVQTSTQAKGGSEAAVVPRPERDAGIVADERFDVVATAQQVSKARRVLLRDELARLLREQYPYARWTFDSGKVACGVSKRLARIVVEQFPEDEARAMLTQYAREVQLDGLLIHMVGRLDTRTRNDLLCKVDLSEFVPAGDFGVLARAVGALFRLLLAADPATRGDIAELMEYVAAGSNRWGTLSQSDGLVDTDWGRIKSGTVLAGAVPAAS